MKPSVLIVHGAWHVPAHFSRFADLLKTSGYDVTIPHLPSCGENAALSTFEDDVLAVRNEIAKIVEDSRQLIVIAHSYGGAVATQSLDQELLTSSSRKSQGLQGGVVHLVYMCAFMLRPGESCFSAAQPRPNPDPIEPGQDGTSFLNQPLRGLLYGDLDEETSRKYESLLVRHNLAALSKNVVYPAWRFVPTSYFECSEDKMLLPECQARMIKNVREQSVEVFVTSFKASHSPYISVPEKIIAAIDQISQDPI